MRDSNANNQQPAAIPEVELEAVIDCYRKDEWGDALLFARLCEDQCVYDYRERCWYLWQGHYWKPDDTGRVRQLVSGPLASVYLRAAAALTNRLDRRTGGSGGQTDAEDEERAESELRSIKGLIKGLVGRAFALRSLSRNKHVLEFATSDHRLTLATERWDANPWLLGTREGVLDLRTGLLRDGAPADYIRTVIPTAWRGLDEPAPRFEEFLWEVFADRREDERAAGQADRLGQRGGQGSPLRCGAGEVPDRRWHHPRPPGVRRGVRLRAVASAASADEPSAAGRRRGQGFLGEILPHHLPRALRRSPRRPVGMEMGTGTGQRP